MMSGVPATIDANQTRAFERMNEAQARERIEELLADKRDREIAEVLNAEGHRTGYGHPVTASRVASLRLRRGMTRARRKPVDILRAPFRWVTTRKTLIASLISVITEITSRRANCHDAGPFRSGPRSKAGAEMS